MSLSLLSSPFVLFFEFADHATPSSEASDGNVDGNGNEKLFGFLQHELGESSVRLPRLSLYLASPLVQPTASLILLRQPYFQVVVDSLSLQPKNSPPVNTSSPSSNASGTEKEEDSRLDERRGKLGIWTKRRRDEDLRRSMIMRVRKRRRGRERGQTGWSRSWRSSPSAWEHRFRRFDLDVDDVSFLGLFLRLASDQTFGPESSAWTLGEIDGEEVKRETGSQRCRSCDTEGRV